MDDRNDREPDQTTQGAEPETEKNSTNEANAESAYGAAVLENAPRQEKKKKNVKTTSVIRRRVYD